MEHDQSDAPIVRQQDFECAGPIEIVVELGGGRVDIHLGGDGEPGTRGAVTVQVRPDTAGRSPWNTGLVGLLSWLGEQTGAMAPGNLTAEAARQTLIDLTERRLTVRAPREAPLRAVPLAVRITAPPGSSVSARCGSADIGITGAAERLEAATGSGEVRAQRCAAAVEVRTGSGDVRLGSVLGRLQLRTGSGSVDVTTLGGTGQSTVRTGSGDVRFGTVRRDVTVRTGSGDIVVVDAEAGELELATGSGQVRVGIHQGVLAELDISSGSGKTRSELPLIDRPNGQDAALRLHARTGSGDALVTAAPG